MILVFQFMIIETEILIVSLVRFAHQIHQLRHDVFKAGCQQSYLVLTGQIPWTNPVSWEDKQALQT
jgi:hypothetical protein